MLATAAVSTSATAVQQPPSSFELPYAGAVSEYTGPTDVYETMTEAEVLADLDALPMSTPVTTVLDAGSVSTPSCIACVGGVRQETVKVSGPTRYNKKFVRYLTGAWAYSTGYAWSSSTTVSATLSASIGVTAKAASGTLGVSATRTQSYSITVNIYASKSKLSKLALYSDYNRYYVKNRTVLGGKPGSWKYGYLWAPLANQYLLATYK